MAGSAIARILRYSVVVATLWYLGAYLVVAWHRLPYPFELEWMEGGSVDHVARVLRYENLYIPPQVAFIPFEYPPLYFYVSAFVAKIVGIGFFPLRLVSFTSSLVCFASIYTIVKAETDSTFSGILATGLFAATFRISGAWFDLARVDSLFLALFLLAIFIIRWRECNGWYLLASVLLSLSFLTKQTALAMALPVVLYMVYSRRRLGLWLAASLIAVVGISTALFHVATDGWYTFYVFEFPFKHAWAKPVFVTFWTRDMFAPLPIAFTFALLLIVWQLRSRREDLFWPMVFVAMMGGAYRSRLQTGGYDNVLIPAYAITAILFGLAVSRLVEAVNHRNITHGWFAEAAIYVGCLVQLVLLGYDPRTQLPRAADRVAGEHLLELLASIHGEVLLPYHGYLPTVVGKPSHAHVMQVFDVLKIRDAHSASLAEQYRSAIRQSAFDAIVLDDRVNYFFMPEIEDSYVMQSRVFSDPGVFFPVTGGVITRPEYVYVPKTEIKR
jgi:4-amino-4-deoxy-L-arabinose transferase-like glycosyltransferase